MSNFLDKLNLLVKASVNKVIDDAASKLTPGQADTPSRLPAAKLGKNIDAEIVALRRQIDDAITQQDKMKQDIAQLDQEIARLDQQIDAALERGNDAAAHQLAVQLQRQQQQRAFIQSDLDSHRRTTSDFIERVNTLEAMVADARREQTESQETPDSGTDLSSLIRDAREQAAPSAASSTPSSASTPSSTEAPAAIKIPINGVKKPADPPAAAPAPAKPEAKPVDDKKVEEDLARRRSRLSKPE